MAPPAAPLPPAPLLLPLLLVAAAATGREPAAHYLGCAPGQPFGTNLSTAAGAFGPLYGPVPATGVTFSVPGDPGLQRLFDAGAGYAVGNRKNLSGIEVMVEGGGYDAVWLETQPMAGGMYAARDLRLALNNQLIFMRTQRPDGRLPGMVTGSDGPTTLHAVFCLNSTAGPPGHCSSSCTPCCGSLLQGMYLASPAVDVHWYLSSLENATTGSAGGADGGARAYAGELRDVLGNFSAWLWRTRRVEGAPTLLFTPGSQDWGGDGFDGYRNHTQPFASMDMLAYAHDTLRSLARLEGTLGNATAQRALAARAREVRDGFRAGIWDAGRHAAYDRDGEGRVVDVLMHNNLRAMWHGVMEQDMADAFVAHHLMNSSEFWTPTPLPCIAVSSPAFVNSTRNNWSGGPQGLTFQRTIRALTAYGHHAELALIGLRLEHSLRQTGTFPQQIDAYTTVPGRGDRYGPMILSLLGYTALRYGIVPGPEDGTLLWSALHPANSTFTQRLGPRVFSLSVAAPARPGVGLGPAPPPTRHATMHASVDERPLFACSTGVRVTTFLNGTVHRVVGISDVPVDVQLTVWAGAGAAEAEAGAEALAYRGRVLPNQEWRLAAGGELRLASAAPFVPPF